MLRPSFLTQLALAAFAVASFTGCRTMYSDMYSPKRNRFKPEKEKPKPTEILPPASTTSPTLMGAPAVPPPADAGLMPPPADAGLTPPPADGGGLVPPPPPQ